jgi:hypothetical protein
MATADEPFWNPFFPNSIGMLDSILPLSISLLLVSFLSLICVSWRIQLGQPESCIYTKASLASLCSATVVKVLYPLLLQWLILTANIDCLSFPSVRGCRWSVRGIFYCKQICHSATSSGMSVAPAQLGRWACFSDLSVVLCVLLTQFWYATQSWTLILRTPSCGQSNLRDWSSTMPEEHKTT